MLIMGNNVLAFTVAHNEFEKTAEKARRLHPYVLVFNKNGDVVESQAVGENSQSKIFGFDGKMRDPLRQVNMDEGVIIDLPEIKEEAMKIVLAVRIPDVASLAKPENQSSLKYSSYGLEYYRSALPIHKQSLAVLKPEELVQAPENPDDPNQPVQAAFVFCYVLSNRPELGGWYLQTLNCTVKGKTQPQEEAFFEELAAFQKNCDPLDREELGEDEEEPEPPKSSSRRSREELKSKKAVKEPEPRKIHISSRILPVTIVELANGALLDELTMQVERAFPEFLQSAPFGW